jgi:quercetin dioxygenase-like cupin family protein
MSRYFPTPEQCGHHLIFGNVPITTFAGERMQISIVDLPADGVIDWHEHANEQMGVLVSGRALFYVGDEVKELQEGDIYFIPGNVRHKVVPVGGPGKAVDFFYPIRDEYR